MGRVRPEQTPLALCWGPLATCRYCSVTGRSGMDPFFVTLGQSVLSRWKARNFDPASFPRIARTLLEEQPPSEHVDVSELLREFLLNDAQPLQSQSGFGQPELVVFEDPRFYIQLLFWLDGSTDIHQHEFSGAFHVASGLCKKDQHKIKLV